MLYFIVYGRKGFDLRRLSIIALPFSQESQSYLYMHYINARFVCCSSSMIVQSSIIIAEPQLIYHINKIMNRKITDPPALSSRIQDIRVAISPSRVQIYRPINPELTPLRQNKSDVYHYAEKEQNIISPFQKDQFLNEFGHATSQKKLYGYGDSPYWRSTTRQQNKQKIAGIIPQVIKMQDIPTAKEALSKSWTNHVEHRQTVTYLQQIVNDLCDKQQFQLTRRYIQKLHNPHLRQKLQGVVGKLQSIQVKKTMDFVHVRQMLVKLLKTYFRYERSIEMASIQRMLKQLQKSIAKNMKEDHRVLRRQSQQKVKQLREESKLLNSKLQRQTKQLYKALQQQKSKMKESYQQIYRRIYEENNKLKKEFQNKEAELGQEKAETQAVKNKYQSIFNEISIQFRDIKLQYNKIVDASAKQAEKNKNLTEEIKFVTQKLKMEQNKARQMQLQLQNRAKKYLLLQDEKNKLEQVSMKYKDYAQKFLGETKKYQNERLQKEKIQNQLKCARQQQIKKNEQQERYTNNLQANIKTNQEILSNQLTKIQQNQFTIQEKKMAIQTLTKELQQIEAQLIICAKKIEESKKQQLNYQQKNVILNEQCKTRQQQLFQMQQKHAIIEKLISTQEQAFIQLSQKSKEKQKIKQNLQREIVIKKQSILNEKQKLQDLNKQIQQNQSKLSQSAQQLTSIEKDIQEANTYHNLLRQQIANTAQELAYIQQLLTNKKYLVQSIQNKLIRLQSNIEVLQKNNDPIPMTETEANSKNEELEISLRVEQMKQLEAKLQSLKKSLKICQEQIAQKKKEKQTVEGSLQLKYEELIHLESEIMIKKSMSIS